MGFQNVFPTFVVAVNWAYLVCVFQAAASAIVILTPFFVPDLRAFLGPLVCPLVGLACWLILLSPFLLPLLTLSEYNRAQLVTNAYAHGLHDNACYTIQDRVEATKCKRRDGV